MTSKQSTITPADAKLDIPKTFALPYATGERANGSVVMETTLILQAMEKILVDAGSSLGKVVKTTVWLHSLLELEDLNGAYRPFFASSPPARTVCGARINNGMKVQIDCIALV